MKQCKISGNLFASRSVSHLSSLAELRFAFEIIKTRDKLSHDEANIISDRYNTRNIAILVLIENVY